MKRRTFAIGAAATVMAGLAGCTEGPSAAEGGGPGSKDGKVELVGLMLQDISNPFFASMQESLQAEADADGIQLNIQDGRQDLAVQSGQIDTFIQQGVDLIILNAVDSEGIGSAVKRAQDAGIPVVAVDVDAKNADAAVTTDNVKAGEISATALAEKIGGKGNILILEGTPTTAPRERVEGCEAILKSDYPDITVVGKQATENSRATGLAVATDLLTANSDIQGIFALNDPVALGADLALKQAQIDDVVVVGVDGSPAAVEAMTGGDTALWATAAQDPAGMVKQAYKIGVDLVAGKKPEERLTLLEPSLVTRDTIGEYAGW